MTKEEILNTFYDDMTEEARRKIDEMCAESSSTSDTYVVRYSSGGKHEFGRNEGKTGILAGLEAHPS
jgi:hypothetical protein